MLTIDDELLVKVRVTDPNCPGKRGVIIKLPLEALEEVPEATPYPELEFSIRN